MASASPLMEMLCCVFASFVLLRCLKVLFAQKYNQQQAIYTSQPYWTSITGRSRERETCCDFLDSPLIHAWQSLMHADLLRFYEKNLKLEQSDLTYGTALKGSTRLFAAFCKLFEEKFKPVVQVKAEHMVTGAGVGSLMDQLVALLCDEGFAKYFVVMVACSCCMSSDGVLLAAPYYSG